MDIERGNKNVIVNDLKSCSKIARYIYCTDDLIERLHRTISALVEIDFCEVWTPIKAANG